MKHTHTLIVGASVSGLASAACLRKQDIEYMLIEKEESVGAPWRKHYERLHLHTSRRFSALPFQPFRPGIPRYPSRQQVIDYLEEYRVVFGITPVFATEAIVAAREGDRWITTTNRGVITSEFLIMATGAYGQPRPIDFKGVESFPGKILHSQQYRSGKDFTGQRVLVVGFGNSACEIALDLVEQGAEPVLSVRSPVNVVPRDIWGIPVLELSLLMRRLPPRVADTISAPLTNWLVGDITKLGLRKMPYGPLEEISRDGNAPVLDIGTIRQIREGRIEVAAGIDGIAGSLVHFRDGKKKVFDAIVAAIGYERNIGGLLKVERNRFDDLRLPVSRQQFFGKDGLYFCGYWISPTGQIREIASDARAIARHIAERTEPTRRTAWTGRTGR